MESNFDFPNKNQQQILSVHQTTIGNQDKDYQHSQQIQQNHSDINIQGLQPEQLKTSQTEHITLQQLEPDDLCSPTQISMQEFDHMSFDSSKHFDTRTIQITQDNNKQNIIHQLQQDNSTGLMNTLYVDQQRQNNEQIDMNDEENQISLVVDQQKNHGAHQYIQKAHQSPIRQSSTNNNNNLVITLNNSKTTLNSPQPHGITNNNGLNSHDQINHQIQQNDQNAQEISDDRLVIKFDGANHLVDSIVQIKRTKQGVPWFKLAMCCQCCNSKSFWFSKNTVNTDACTSLKNLMNQVEEYHLDGIDIRSRKTNEQLDDEDEDEEDEDMNLRILHTWANESNMKNLSLELIDCNKSKHNEKEAILNQSHQNIQYLINSNLQQINKTTHSVKFADDDMQQVQRSQFNRRGRGSISKIGQHKSQSVFNCKPNRKSTDARRRGGATEDDLPFQHCETEKPNNLCTKLSQNHSLVSNKSLVSGYGCTGTAAFYYNNDDYTNGAINELIAPPFFNLSEEDGEAKQIVDKIDDDDDISMMCEIQAENNDQSQYQIISQASQKHLGDNESPLAIHSMRGINGLKRNESINDQKINQQQRATTTSMGGFNPQTSIISMQSNLQQQLENQYKNMKQFEPIPFAKRNLDCNHYANNSYQMNVPYQNINKKSKKRKQLGGNNTDLFDMRTVNSSMTTDHRPDRQQQFNKIKRIKKQIPVNSQRNIGGINSSGGAVFRFQHSQQQHFEGFNSIQPAQQQDDSTNHQMQDINNNRQNENEICYMLSQDQNAKQNQ